MASKPVSALLGVLANRQANHSSARIRFCFKKRFVSGYSLTGGSPGRLNHWQQLATPP